MKKLLFAICATALLGLATGCVDPMNGGVNNSNYDPVKNVVKTKFVLNIAATDEVGTKQTSATVQRPGTAFRGLSNATLFTYQRGDANDGKIIVSNNDVPAISEPLKQSYVDLSAMIPSDALSLDDNANASSRVLQISLPLNTNSLMFWGMATPGAPRDGLSVKDEFGSLSGVVEIADTLQLKFIGSKMDTRLVERDNLLQIEAMIMFCLNGLMKVGINGTNPWDNYQIGSITAGVSGAKTYDFTGKTLSFKDYLTSSANTDKRSPIPAKFGQTAQNAAPLEEILGSLYYQLATFGTNEIRAGSGKSILRMLQDVYNVCKKGIQATPTNTEELIVQKLMIQMVKYLSYFTDASISETDQGVTLWDLKSWKTAALVHEVLSGWYSNQYIAYTYRNAPANHTLVHFPHDFALPQGACVLKKVTESDTEEYARGDIFRYYVDDIDISGMGRAGLTMSVEDYSYPVPLCYFGNSPIRVNNNSSFEDTYANGINNWVDDNAAGWSGWTNDSHVISSTRGVAMKYNIQYGVALLETKVKFSSEVASDKVMNDNNKEGTTGTVPVSTDNAISLTGILVGGQPNQVGWDYLSVGTGDAHYTKMIYDRALTTYSGDDYYYTAVPKDGSSSEPNYTLVYDNYTADAKGQYTVYVALEFKNNTGKDFWGLGNIVRKDGIFYLIGKLTPYTVEPTTEPASAGQLKEISWPNESTTKQIVPPYNADGTGKKITRVFIQDFMTSATFVLGKDSLKSAYVTVPDLSATRITLGLSVDLNWNTGLNFDDIVLGSN